MPKPPTSRSGNPRKRHGIRIDPALLEYPWPDGLSPTIERLLYAEMDRLKAAKIEG